VSSAALRGGTARLVFALVLSQGLVMEAADAHADGPTATVEFESPGSKRVTLTVCNLFGCQETSQTVVVLSPWPELTDLTVGPARVAVGRTLFLKAAATGRPPLRFQWEVAEGGAPLAILEGPGVTWRTDHAAPGTLTVTLTVSNSAGSVTASRSVQIVPAVACGFVPIAPGCRLADLTAAPVAAGASRLVAAGGECGIPTSACAVAAHVVAMTSEASGDLSLRPGDDPWPLVTALPARPNALSSGFEVLPLSQDGAATIAAGFSAAVGTVAFLLDVSGYFAPLATVAVPLLFADRLCPFGFCETAVGAPVFFSEAFSAPAASYRYDWTGSGSFSVATSKPITAHRYTAPGVFTPAVETVDGSAVVVLRHALPIIVVSADPGHVPPAPTGVRATFIGELSSSTVDPTLGGPVWGFALAAAPGAPDLLGYNAYVTEGGGPPELVGAFLLPWSEAPPLAIRPVPAGISAFLQLTAVSTAGEGAPSVPLPLSTAQSSLVGGPADSGDASRSSDRIPAGENVSPRGRKGTP
jgi:PKD repeat protein